MGFFNWLLGESPSPPIVAQKMGRNELCWCGSGKKYKRCHLESDTAYFAKNKAAPTCTNYG